MNVCAAFRLPVCLSRPALVITVAWAMAGCAPSEAETSPGRAPSWSDADWSVFEQKARWALDGRLDTLPLGEVMASLGRSFVGTPYVPGTLEVEGPERLVINFQGLDCVTFVENVFAMSRFVRLQGARSLLNDRGAAEDQYEALLTEHRYRRGIIDGYPSRLHYFTEWLADGESRGLLSDISRELGAVLDYEPVDFMSTHPDAYRQLAAPDYVAAVREAEARISAAGRWYVPETDIEAAAHGIQNGDVIAATSTVAGLDVAHTGLALWVDGALHLLHAPLVGEAVQVSEAPLADRIRGIAGQDGIIVARPMDRR